MYPIAGSIVENEHSLKPTNMFIIESNTKPMCIVDNCADNIIILVDIIDRLGAVSMLEVAMSQRNDVATFLCKHSPTCLDRRCRGKRYIDSKNDVCISSIRQVLKKHTSK